MQKFKRNENGMVDGVEYPIGKDGLIEWFKLVKPQNLVLNKQHQSKLEKKYGDTFFGIQGKMQSGELEVEDNFKLILLQGIKDLCFLRGYKSVTYPFTHVDSSGVYSRCQIVWSPNEECPNEEVFEDGADATTYNTNGFAQQYLTAISLNRSFVRAVRNYLRIPVLGFDEIGTNEQDSSKVGVEQKTEQKTENRARNSEAEAKSPDKNYGIQPQARVEKAADEISMSFEVLKKKAVASKFEGSKDWGNYSDIPDKLCMKLIGILKKLKEKENLKS